MEFWDRVFSQDLAEGQGKERVVLSWNATPVEARKRWTVLFTNMHRPYPDCSELLARRYEATLRMKSGLRVCRRREVAG